MKKQIEETRKDLVEIFNEEYNKKNLITADNTAKKMLEKGYHRPYSCLPLDVHEDLKRRAVEKAKAEVAREIFEELHQKRNELWNKGNYTMFECWCNAEEELRKKYAEGATDERAD